MSDLGFFSLVLYQCSPIGHLIGFTARHLTRQFFLQVQTTTMCISVSLSGFVVLGCLFAPKVHIILFQPQKNVVTHRLHLNRFSVSGTGTTYSQCKYGFGTNPSIHSIVVGSRLGGEAMDIDRNRQHVPVPMNSSIRF